MRYLLVLAAAVLGFVLLSQGGPAPAEQETPGAGAAPGCAAPLRVVAFQDKSRSGTWNRTPQLRTHELAPVAERVAACGGQVALGLIGVDSNRPLVRMHVGAPPVPPVKPDLEGNPFFARAALDEYERVRAEHEERAAAHERAAQAEMERFLGEARELLASSPDQQRTDVWGAVDRAAYVFGEPPRWPLPPRDVLILISDAEDNVETERVLFPARVEVYLVNGDPSLGTLEELAPIRVEAVSAALREVLR